ncbi:MAG: nitroreductase family protein [Chloroflexota bacterium]
MQALDNAPEVAQAIKKVRQARKYTTDQVPKDVVDELLEIARWTGSSRNTQPWHFIVIDDKEQLRKISQLRDPINWVADAPLAIAIVLNGDAEVSEAYDEGRVTERLMIGAHIFGFGGGVAWFGNESQQAQAKEILSIPAENTARSVVTVGQPATLKDHRPSPATPGRKPISELVSHNRMSG